jgi:hypothetical protein
VLAPPKSGRALTSEELRPGLLNGTLLSDDASLLFLAGFAGAEITGLLEAKLARTNLNENVQLFTGTIHNGLSADRANSHRTPAGPLREAAPRMAAGSRRKLPFTRCKGMSFNQDAFLNVHIPYRLANLELFSHALRIVLSQPQPQSARVTLDIGHEIRGPFWILTNPWVETGILTCRLLVKFLEAKPSKHEDDVLITMFKDSDGGTLDAVSLETIVRFGPVEISENKALAALKFTCMAADKRVAHLTFGSPENDEELLLYQITSIAIHGAIGYYLYKRMGLNVPPSIFSQFRRNEIAPPASSSH